MNPEDLQKLIKSPQDNYQKCYILRKDGYSFIEIGRFLGIAEITASTYYYNELSRRGECLRNHQGHYNKKWIKKGTQIK